MLSILILLNIIYLHKKICTFILLENTDLSSVASLYFYFDKHYFLASQFSQSQSKHFDIHLPARQVMIIDHIRRKESDLYVL